MRNNIELNKGEFVRGIEIKHQIMQCKVLNM